VIDSNWGSSRSRFKSNPCARQSKRNVFLI
jgi:hypothetical protein